MFHLRLKTHHNVTDKCCGFAVTPARPPQRAAYLAWWPSSLRVQVLPRWSNSVRQLWAFPRYKLKTVWLLTFPLLSKWKPNYTLGICGVLSDWCSHMQVWPQCMPASSMWRRWTRVRMWWFHVWIRPLLRLGWFPVWEWLLSRPSRYLRPPPAARISHVKNSVKQEVSFPTSCFQETTVTAAHVVGAFLFFVPGIVYIILQVLISFRAYPIGSSISMCWARLGFAIIATLAFFPCILPHKSYIFPAHKDVVPNFPNWLLSCHLRILCGKNVTAQTQRWSGRFLFSSPVSKNNGQFRQRVLSIAPLLVAVYMTQVYFPSMHCGIGF